MSPVRTVLIRLSCMVPLLYDVSSDVSIVFYECLLVLYCAVLWCPVYCSVLSCAVLRCLLCILYLLVLCVAFTVQLCAVVQGDRASLLCARASLQRLSGRFQPLSGGDAGSGV